MNLIRISVEKSHEIKLVKDWLEDRALLNKSQKILRHGEISYIFTTISSHDKFQINQLLSNFHLTIDDYAIANNQEMQDRTTSPISIIDSIHQYYCQNNIQYNTDLDDYIPKRWTVYPPMVLFKSNTFDSPLWAKELLKLDQHEFFKFLLDQNFPKSTHIAVNKPINKQSIMRVPLNILPLYGDFGPQITQQLLENPSLKDFDDAFWCSTVQNGIYQTWAPSYTMFSRGNIKEKKRLLDEFKDLKQSYVLDFYAGIGYFSLSYLKNNAKLLCWEMNPWSVEALRRNSKANNFTSKVDDFNYDDNTDIYIYNDNNETSIQTVNKLLNNPSSIPISHINLGLLPSSKQSWDIAKHFASISSLKTFIHIHENVHVDDFDTLSAEIMQYFPCFELHKIVKVKTFAPDIWHAVFDIQLQ